MHDFPSGDQLIQQRQRLGDLLMSWRAIDSTKLEQALAIQEKEHRPLGEILLELGYLDQDTLNEAISFQNTNNDDSQAPGPTAQKVELT